MRLFHKPKPRSMTEDEIAASAASWLARYAGRKRSDARLRLIRQRCAELRRGPVSPIRPREINIAPVRARRGAQHV